MTDFIVDAGAKDITEQFSRSARCLIRGGRLFLFLDVLTLGPTFLEILEVRCGGLYLGGPLRGHNVANLLGEPIMQLPGSRRTQVAEEDKERPADLSRGPERHQDRVPA